MGILAGLFWLIVSFVFLCAFDAWLKQGSGKPMIPLSEDKEFQDFWEKKTGVRMEHNKEKEEEVFKKLMEEIEMRRKE